MPKTFFLSNQKMGVFSPASIPYSWMGPLGDFLHYMNYSQRALTCGLFAFTAVVHIGEGLYAYVLARLAVL